MLRTWRLSRIPPLTFDDAERFDLQEHEVGQFQRLIERVDPRQVEAMLSASAASLNCRSQPLAR